ncbi:putative tail fiber protein [Pseudaeromonas phage vB_PpeM_ KLEP7]|nr:putative tail fiber protein [Pseudaeromonas phage vB_PpeM_ KLEP7]
MPSFKRGVDTDQGFSLAGSVNNYTTETLPDLSYLGVGEMVSINGFAALNSGKGLSFSDEGTVDIRQFGGKCDAVKTTGGVVTSGSPSLSDSAASFMESDVGKLLYVAGAGIGGSCLVTTIAGVISSTSILMASVASVTCASAHYIYGTDDTQAWANAFSYVGDNRNMTVCIPYGLSLTDCAVVKTNQQVKGRNADGWAFRNGKRASGLLIKPDSRARGGVYAFSGSVGNVELSNFYIDGAFRFRTNAICRYSGATTTAASNTVTFSNGTFVASDIGKTIVVFGAGVGGALQEGGYIGEITSVTDTNTITVLDVQNPATKAVNNAAYVYGFYDQYGSEGVTTSGSATFTTASGQFTQDDVGKAIDLFNVMAPVWGTGNLNDGDNKGEFLSCHIVSVESSTNITLSTKPELTLTSVKWRIGHINGVYQQEAPLSQDSMWDVGKLNVLYMSGHGYSMGNWQRAQRINNVNLWQCLGYGMVMMSSDNSVDQSMAAYCGLDGWYVNQSTNRFVNIDSFNNEGNGMYFGGYGSMCTTIGASIDYNGKNGVVSFAKGTRIGSGTRFTSNSQKKHGAYSDLTFSRRLASGVTRAIRSGCQYWGAFHEQSTGSNTNRPNWLVDAVGGWGVRGTGVELDADTSAGMYVTGPTTSGTTFSSGHASAAIEAGVTITYRDNNTLSFTGGGTKLGAAATEKLAFYGASPIVRPAITGAKAGNVALTNLITQLVALGIISDSTT